jgi:hypothetical protein
MPKYFHFAHKAGVFKVFFLNFSILLHQKPIKFGNYSVIVNVSNCFATLLFSPLPHNQFSIDYRIIRRAN